MPSSPGTTSKQGIRAGVALAASAVLVATSMFAAGAQADSGSRGPVAGAAAPGGTYKPCKDIKVKLKGKRYRYTVARLKMKCKPARLNSRYVLTRRISPPGWECSLPNFPLVGACSRGKKGFAFHRRI